MGKILPPLAKGHLALELDNTAAVTVDSTTFTLTPNWIRALNRSQLSHSASTACFTRRKTSTYFAPSAWEGSFLRLGRVIPKSGEGKGTPPRYGLASSRCRACAQFVHPKAHMASELHPCDWHRRGSGPRLLIIQGKGKKDIQQAETHANETEIIA